MIEDIEKEKVFLLERIDKEIKKMKKLKAKNENVRFLLKGFASHACGVG